MMGAREYNNFKALLGICDAIDAIRHSTKYHTPPPQPPTKPQNQHAPGAYLSRSKLFKDAKAEIIAEIKKSAS